jgi:hypothetical protein
MFVAYASDIYDYDCEKMICQQVSFELIVILAHVGK